MLGMELTAWNSPLLIYAIQCAWHRYSKHQANGLSVRGHGAQVDMGSMPARDMLEVKPAMVHPTLVGVTGYTESVRLWKRGRTLSQAVLANTKSFFVVLPSSHFMGTSVMQLPADAMAFLYCNYTDDGGGCSSAATLCEALGISSPSAPDLLQTVAVEQSQCIHKENEFGLMSATESVVVNPRADPHAATVFVWDLDETLIIFQTLLNGRYAELFDGSKDPQKATLLGRRWERLILEVCDEYFYYKQVEEYNYPNVDSLQDYDDGIDLARYDFEDYDLFPPFNADHLRKLTYRHRYASNLYEQGLGSLLSPEQMKEWQDLYEATDMFTDRWLSAGRQKLEEFQRANQKASQDECRAASADRNDENEESSCAAAAATPSLYNVLVTSGTLIPSLVKCLLFKLDRHFHPSNIYSSREVSKLHCFQLIIDCFLPNTPKFCVLGDGVDECEAARIRGWPFVKIGIEPGARHRLPALSFAVVEEYLEAAYGRPDDPAFDP